MAIKYYTGSGDKKLTSIGSSRLSKADTIFKAIGDIDELNTKIGMLRTLISNKSDKYLIKKGEEILSLEIILLNVQSSLFSIGATLASSVNSAFAPKREISSSEVMELEKYTNSFGGAFPQLKSFVLPGGCVESAAADEARAVARRAERSIIEASKSFDISNQHIFAYANRLSSMLFVIARFANSINGVKEQPPNY